MQYNETSFFELADAVEATGGQHLDELCSHRTFEEFSGKQVTKPCVLPGCGQSALMEFPYPVKEDKDGDVLEARTVKLCAVDDALGAFPRFGGNKYASITTKALFHIHGDTLNANDPRTLGR
jgi:hypothetical protein